jgi:uncharacterized protein
MEQRLSLITLGVRDVSRTQAFYEALGWHVDGGVNDETDHVAFFQAGGMIVALWDRSKLADDSGVKDSGGWGGVTLGHNVRLPEEVDAVLAEVARAGATIPRYGAATFWGWVFRRLHRPRRSSVGSGAQPGVDAPRRWPRHLGLSVNVRVARSPSCGRMGA